MRYIDCNLCGSNRSHLLANCPDYLYPQSGKVFSLVRCDLCGFVYINPVPDESEIETYYPENYGNYVNPNAPLSKIEKFTRQLQMGYIVQKLGYLRPNTTSLFFSRILSLFLGNKYIDLPKFIRGGRLLDMGCATGKQMLFFREIGWEVYGVEPNANAVRLAREAGLTNVFEGTLEQAQYPNDFFDCIRFHHVLEHLHRPLQTLEEVYRILKSGGCVSIVVPSIDAWLFRRFNTSWFALDIPRHLCHFSPKILKTMLHQAGFQKAECYVEWSQGDIVETISRAYFDTKGKGTTIGRKIIWSKLIFIGLMLAKPMFAWVGPGSTLKAIAWK